MAVYASHREKENVRVDHRLVLDPRPLNRNFAPLLGAISPVFACRGRVILPHNASIPHRFRHYTSVTQMEEESSISLRQFMINEELLPSSAEEERRRIVVQKLKKIVVRWVKRVAWQRRLPKHQISATHATMLTYGSYGLGVHGPDSDLDVLCIGPYFATMAEDFFIGLRNMLKSRPDVTGIHCVKDAKVPLMRFKFDGISVDLPYVQLKVLSVPDNVDVLNPLFLRNIDETSWKSLSGVRVNSCIHRLVPDLEKFQSLLRCVKLWAKRRGIYGNLNGFLGGVHLGILAAFICQSHSHASLSALVYIFFDTFAHWSWPLPVALRDGILPPVIPADKRSLIPIRLPFSPHEYCHSNVTRSTFYRIRTEFLRGHSITRGNFRPGFNWQTLFERVQYTKKYTRFIRIYLSASDQDELVKWAGWVKSRFPWLLVKLEETYGLCDPNPTEYVDQDSKQPNVVFYWGVQSRSAALESVEVEFSKCIDQGYRRPLGTMQISIVQASLFPKTDPPENRGKRVKACWRVREDRHQRAPAQAQDIRVNDCKGCYN